MGVPGLWDILSVAAEKASLTSIATNPEWHRSQNSSNTKHIRPEPHRLRIAVDVSIWAFQIGGVRGGVNPDLRTLFYRLCRLWRLGIEAVFVFDGPERPAWKRGHYVLTASKRTEEKETEYIELINMFGFPVHRARGEAEAECAILQQRGYVDWVLTEDVDAFLFGADAVMRNWTAIDAFKKKKGTEDEELARLLKGVDDEEKKKKKGKVGSRTKTTRQQNTKDDCENTHTHVPIFKAKDIQDILDLDQDGLIFVALLSGSDYIPKGAADIGIKTAVALARAGWGRRMCTIIRSSKEKHDFSKLRHEIEKEIQTNSSGLLTRRRPFVKIPDDFPDEDIVRSYLSPCTTIEGLGDNFEFHWGERPKVADIATWCHLKCNWAPSFCLKTLIRCLFPGVAIWDLQKSLVDAPLARSASSQDIIQSPIKLKPKPIPPRKTPSKSAGPSFGTPSSTQKSITNFFSVTKKNTLFNSESKSSVRSPSTKLSTTTSITPTAPCILNSTYPTVVAIHSRRHKDNVDEFRVEWADAAIQAFANEATSRLASTGECTDIYSAAIKRCWVPTTTIQFICSDQIKAFEANERDRIAKRSRTRRTLKKAEHLPSVNAADRDGLIQTSLLNMVVRKECRGDKHRTAKVLDTRNTTNEERKNESGKCVDSMASAEIEPRIVVIKFDENTPSNFDIIIPNLPRCAKVLKVNAAGRSTLKAHV